MQLLGLAVSEPPEPSTKGNEVVLANLFKSEGATSTSTTTTNEGGERIRAGASAMGSISSQAGVSHAKTRKVLV